MTSPFTGHVFDLQGVDAAAQAITAAPALGSDELAAEMAEVYAMALLRDAKFEDIDSGAGAAGGIATALAGMPWFASAAGYTGIGDRHRPLTGPADLFRGSTPGSHNGPWLSQFLLVGNRGPGGARHLGAAARARLARRWTTASSTTARRWSTSAAPSPRPATTGCRPGPPGSTPRTASTSAASTCWTSKRQFLTTPRDIATYVHFDALYQAYQVACLLMLAGGAPFGKDRGMPESNSRTRSAFASFGGPHILSLVTEVSTRALKLVWRQKWMHHRRLRPEVVAGLLTLHANDPAAIPDAALRTALAELQAKIPASMLSAIAAKNTADTSGCTHRVGRHRDSQRQHRRLAGD